MRTADFTPRRRQSFSHSQHCGGAEFARAEQVQRNIGFFQWECFRLRSNGNARRDFKEFVAVASGQVCHSSNHALLP